MNSVVAVRRARSGSRSESARSDTLEPDATTQNITTNWILSNFNVFARREMHVARALACEGQQPRNAQNRLKIQGSSARAYTVYSCTPVANALAGILSGVGES